MVLFEIQFFEWNVQTSGPCDVSGRPNSDFFPFR